MKCQICGSTDVKLVGYYRPYLDYGVDIFDCEVCRSRFAPHDKDAHEKLHSQSSKYFAHKDMETEIVSRLRKADVIGARLHLRKELLTHLLLILLIPCPLPKTCLKWVAQGVRWRAIFWHATGKF